MSWLPKREKLDPPGASAIDFAVAQDGNFYVPGEAGQGSQSCWQVRMIYSGGNRM